ncbi:MAG TPA: glycosyltransferase [Candidatus Krumholzibacteria bacterium]|nr:glycosyltransferase [Candidatus Krumholzibacteria bacterium]
MSDPRFVLSTTLLPWPANQGSRRFTLELARSLLALGQVRWISRAGMGSELARQRLESEGFEIRLDEEWADLRALSRLRRRFSSSLRAWREDVPRIQVFACTQRMQEMVREEVAADPKAIVVGPFWYQSAAVALGQAGRRVLVLSDLEYQREAARLSRDPEGPLPRVAERLRRAEKDALLSCDALLCLTEDDMRLADHALDTMPGAKRPALGVWPAVVPVRARPLNPAPREPEAPQRWLCYGHWSAAFNRDGLVRFLQESWPAILRGIERPPELRVAGAGLGPKLRRVIEKAGAVAVGWVDELETELAACDAVVVPLEYAGGLRYRMLEAQAAGRPVICTPVAARGSGAEARIHYLQAENPAEWARAWRFLEDPERSRKLAEAGYAFVRTHYGPDSRAERLRRVLEQSLGREVLEARA